MKKFSIHFDEGQMDDLRRRIDCTRLPELPEDGNWALGTDRGYLRSLLGYWRNGYSWARKEAELNRYPQYICEVKGLNIHFFHICGAHKDAKLLLLTHGWPDSFLRYAKVFSLLSDYDLGSRGAVTAGGCILNAAAKGLYEQCRSR